MAIMMRILIFAVFTLLCFLPGKPIAAESLTEASPIQWEKIERLPKGTEIRIVKNKDGTETRTLDFPGKVQITETRSIYGSQGSMGSDNSGKGAILCTWMIYGTTKHFLDVCGGKNDQGARMRLDKTIDKINDFIVANSLTPVTKDELNKKIKTMGFDESRMSKEELLKVCQSKDMRSFGDYARTTPEDKFNAAIEDALSIPRPPVLNPCL